MSKIQWEYDLVGRPFCAQLEAMGWQWLDDDRIARIIEKPGMAEGHRLMETRDIFGEFFSARTANKPARIEVRDLGFRWGSCGRDGVVRFNWRLLPLPVRLVDYVILGAPEHGRVNEVCEPLGQG